MYTYIENMTDDGMKYSVGFYKSGAKDGDDWLPDITVNSRQEAAERVSYLNGGDMPYAYKVLDYIVVCHNDRMPHLVYIPHDKKVLTQKAREIIRGYNSNLPKASKHRARIYHLQWWHGKKPVIHDFMAEDLDSEVYINPIKLPPMTGEDIHHKEFDV